MQNKQVISNILNLETKTLREHNNQHIIVDLLICIKDDTNIGSWVEDIYEAEDGDYPYTADEAKQLLTELNITY